MPLLGLALASGLGAFTCMHVLVLGPVSASAGVIGLYLRPLQMFCAQTTPPRFHMRVNAREPYAYTACMLAWGEHFAAELRVVVVITMLLRPPNVFCIPVIL
eukprot:351748-Chlamydomonas_euryale.AAC.2